MAKPDGKIALITGRGIGLATTMRFVDEGAHVFITGRCEAELASAVKDIGKNVKAVKGDVPKLDELDCIFTQIKEDSGKLDIDYRRDRKQ
jgi:NAD(P)-dependent dehydrogenase (short-subunit alcohol dehydrogenase family)